MIAIAGALLTLGLAAGGAEILLRRAPEPVVQPIAFSHKRHADEGMACADCHRHAADGAHATTPLLATCLLCHQEPKGEHPDEPRIRELAAEGREIPWVQVNRLPGHVYFSHEAHVTWGAMECGECHGRIEEESLPLRSAQIDALTMARCMKCHEQRGASNDCAACHK